MTPASPERLRERRRRKEQLAQIARNEKIVAKTREQYANQTERLSQNFYGNDSLHAHSLNSGDGFAGPIGLWPF